MIEYISYATQTTEGTKAWDTFLSLVATLRKLGISFFEYARDRSFTVSLQGRGGLTPKSTIYSNRI